MPRQLDVITIETAAGTFDRFSRCQVVNDIFGPTEATFDLGDDESWQTLAPVLYPGQSVRVALNGRPRLTGRAEISTGSASPDEGTKIALTVRTKMADARYTSADPRITVKDTSIKDFVLACYAELGFAEDDFLFAPFTARDLMTGKAQGAADPTDLEPIKVDQAKVNPPETIFEAVERHLRRYRATHWDSPDGKIIVGSPDDTQTPIGNLVARAGPEAKANNLKRIKHIRDWSEVAAMMWVVGQSPGRDTRRKGLRGFALDDEVFRVSAETGHFNRRAIIPRQEANDQQQVTQQAVRELSARRRNKSAWELVVDGWSYWNGDEQIPWAHNTVVDVDVVSLGGPFGRALVTKVALDLDLEAGTRTTLTVVAPGTIVL